MIITIFSADDSAKRSILAVNLAALCALNHRKALLIDTTAQKYALHWSTRRDAADVKAKMTVRGTEGLRSELEDPASYYRTHYRDIIIDADGVDSWNTNSALVATDVLVIPMRSGQDDLRSQENLVQRIETLRLFSPALRVLVVDVQPLSASGNSAKREFDAAAVFAKKALTATLADTAIHEWIDDRRTFDRGISIFECEPCNERAVAEMKVLYQEISNARNVPLEAAARCIAILNALQRRTHENAGDRY